MRVYLKYFFLCVALIGACYSSYAQFYSKRISLLANTNGSINSIKVFNDTVYAMCGIIDTTPPFKPIGMFAIFNKSGDIILRNVINLPQRTSIVVAVNSLIQTNDGGFAYCGSDAGATIDGNQNTLLLLKYDHSGFLQWYKEITDSNSVQLEATVLLQDRFSNFYITGVIQHKGTYDIDGFVTKTDSLGDLQYYKVLNNPGMDDEYSSLIINTQNHIVLGGITSPPLNLSDLSDTKGFYKISILDTFGNVQQSFIGNDSNGPAVNNILETSNGSYLTTGGYYCDRNSNHTSAHGAIKMFDSNFNEIWQTDTGSCSIATSLYSNLLLPDQNYLTSGLWNESEDTLMRKVSGWILKYSSNGQVLWSKEYNGIQNLSNAGYYNALGSISYFSDSTIICAGESINNEDTINRQKGWLLHLDKNGCLPDSNSCGIIDAIIEPVSSEGSIRVYPNPSTDLLTIECRTDQPSAKTVSICNMLGQVMTDHILSANESFMTQDVKLWPAAVYSYRFISESGFTASGSFVVSH